MAEKEYIERGALAEEIASLSVTVTGLRCEKGYLKEIVEHYKNSVEKIIDDQPIADVVEVVRCKDCVHRDPEDRKCDQHMSNNIFARQDNDYCSYGERKEQQ